MVPTESISDYYIYKYATLNSEQNNDDICDNNKKNSYNVDGNNSSNHYKKNADNSNNNNTR